MASTSEFGRPGRRADLARELHVAFAQQGIDLLPGRARQILDERVADVAAQMRISEQAALRYLPADWPEQMAADVALEQEQARIGEQTASGVATIPVARIGALIAGLAVAVQNSVWRAMDGARCLQQSVSHSTGSLPSRCPCSRCPSMSRSAALT